MKYEAKNVSGVATSVAAGTPWVSISQTSALATSQAACDGCHLMTEAEWMTVAANVLSVPSNWSGNAVGSGYIYSGHNDNSPANSLAASTNDSDGYNGETNTGGNQRRTLTLTNGQVVWDLAGNVNEWTNETIAGGQPGTPGFDWRNWNTLTTQGALSPSSFPIYASSLASGWTSSQGIGQLYSASDDGSVRGFLRGGTLSTGSGAGVLALNISSASSSASTYIGFRVSR